ncbi:MAG: DUF3592 domain-containing protein [Clostridia bacterium]|nr:DUF3592 domain-containing protein [Clostridia bacterium]
MAETIGMFFAGIGVCLALWALLRLIRRKKAENAWARCTADMHSAVARRAFFVARTDPVMTYTVADKTYMTRMHTADAGTIHQTGGRYGVLYDPQKPENAVFEVDTQNSALTRTLFWLAGALTLAGVAVPLAARIVSH